MSLCLPLPRHAEATTLSTTASACLLRPRIRLRLGLVSCRTAANALAAASPDAATGLARGHHASVAAFSPRTSYSPRPGGGGGFLLLTVAASAVAISTSVVFFSAIHSLLDCKRAAESLEKSFDSTRKKLPETMASVRLLGREVSDLAVDLSDLRQISQELRMGVKSSMSVVHTAEAQLHQLTTPAPQGTLQRVVDRKKGSGEPLLASTVRELRELIAGIRSGFGVAFGIASLFMWASNFGSKRPMNRS